MNLDTWKPLVQQKMKELGHWLKHQPKAPYLVYGTLCGLSLYPLVAQAVAAGPIAPALGGLFSVAGGVGANLVANQVEAWKNRADKPTEAEVIAWTEQQAQNPDARDYLDEMITKLDALKAAHLTPEWHQQLLAELQKLGNLPRFQATLEGIGLIIQGEGHQFHAPVTVIGKQIIHEAPPPPPDPAELACAEYLANLVQQCELLPIAALAGDESAGQEMNLAQVYVALNTTRRIHTISEEDLKRSRNKVFPTGRAVERALTAWEAASELPRLVLLGDPGSGKSSFVRHLAMGLARGYVDPAQQLPDWPRLLPVLTALRDLAPRLVGLKLSPTLSAEQREKKLVGAIWEQWQADLAQYNAEAFAPALEKQLRAGQVALFLDGLDEVAEGVRGLVQQAVVALIHTYRELTRIIITCRVRYWRADLFPDFKVNTLAPFDEEQIRNFVTAWYRAQTQPPISRFTEAVAKERIEDLHAAATRPDLLKLAENPMLLTTMALVHQRETKLPQERVKLYSRAVGVLVERWQGQSKGWQEWQASPELRAWLSQEHKWRPALERLAYEAHRRQATLQKPGFSEKPGFSLTDQPGDLSRGEIVTLLEEQAFLGSLDLAGKFLDYVDQRAGLLVGRGGDSRTDRPSSYTFPHRTFQEYLAGCYLISGRRAAGQIRPLAEEGDFWAVAVQLGAEELLYNKRETEKFLDLAYGLCPSRAPQTPAEWRQTVWSGEMAVQRGRDEIERDSEPDGGVHYLERLIPRLVEAMQGSMAYPLPVVERAAAGRHLAVLGDPRPGVGVVMRAGVKIPDIAWGKLVPAGTYQIGGDNDARYSFEQREVRIEQAYQLACYPVTHTQFDCFVQADDFDNPRWWVGMPPEEEVYGWRYKLQELSEPAFPLANHPQENITWYQAIAFCRWLSDKLGYEVDLPHEFEWEAAARYPDNRFYPWGDEFDPERANTEENALNSTTAVGLYPQGANEVLGLVDLSGNVWEWCRNKRDDLIDMQIDDSGARRVSRGGSWEDNKEFARVAYRNYPYPMNRDEGHGCRVVRRSSSHDL